MRTIGQYYHDEVLSLPKKKLKKIELPSGNDETRIDLDLFGIKLYSGREYIECRSEKEARYLKVFLDSGVTEVYVPKDDEYLKAILPQLEYIKAKIDEFLADAMYSLFDRKLKAQLKHEVFMEVTKEI
jgi:hypothetical protein